MKYMIADKLSVLLVFLVLVISGSKVNAAQDYMDYVYEIERSFAEQMNTEFGLLLQGDMNRMREKVEGMGMKFVTYRHATVEEARALELLVIDKFVQAINDHEKIQPYLDISPFSFKRATISISFKGINGFISDGSITYITNVSELACTSFKNEIVYYSHDPFKDELIVELREPYEEALGLNAASTVNPTLHQENAYELEMEALLDSFAREVQKELGIDTCYIGGKSINGIKEIGAKFVLNQFVTQEEARQLLVEVTEKLLSTINSNEKVRPYLKEYPFPANLLKIHMNIEKKSFDEFPDVRIVSLTLEGNLINYVQEILHPKEEGKLFRYSEKIVLPTESYQEALKIVEDNPQEFKRKSPFIFDYFKNWLTKLSDYFIF